MIWDNFKSHFHESWHSKIRPFIESEACDKIYAKLKEDGRRGVKIAPNSNLTFRAFQETPLNECRAIIMGLCPYHTFINGSPVADGLSLSCGITNKMQPSLTVFLDAIEDDVYKGLALDREKRADLTYLAKDEKILLINAGLTTSKDKAGNMVDLWEPFMRYILEEVVGYTGIPIIFLGKEAGKLEKYVTPFTHIFHLTHPSFFARLNQPMDHKNVFSTVSEIVRQNNGFIINWLPKIENKHENN